MTLRPTDMLEIQSAIDQYERKFPRRPAPSAEVALAWRLGKREAARRMAQHRNPDLASSSERKPASEIAQQECNRLVWMWQQVGLWLHQWLAAEGVPTQFEGLLPWVRGALRVGWWGLIAVVVASIFFIGAVVGGFK
jgi:hypothetical protein